MSKSKKLFTVPLQRVKRLTQPKATSAKTPHTAPEAAAPIGIFDSGVGGLTVARAIMDQLPHERIVYVGDTKNAPYGPLPLAKVRAYALGIMDELVDSGVKMLVIACNSASAAVLRDARERYTVKKGIPVIEVIQPAVRRAVGTSRTGNIGVIATAATVKSRAYEDAFAAAPDVVVSTAACPDFVDFVEQGITSGDVVISKAQEYLAPILAKEIDTLILGCTHYPLLSGVLSYVCGPAVNLVSSAEETAQDVYRALVEHGLENPDQQHATYAEHEFLSTGDAQAFHELAHRFLGPEVNVVRKIDHVQAVYPTGSIPLVNTSK